VPRRPREIELSVERPLGPDGPQSGVARLTARFAIGPGEEPPTASELAKALDDLRADMDGLVGAPIAGVPIGRADRDLTELVGAYRPRQRELVDLLRDEGEITPGEHALLVQYLAAGGITAAPAAEAPPPPAPEPMADRPLAAMPIGVDRPAGSGGGRPVAELLHAYQISNLKQAGAVRARRQISFAEYMALKRHFEQDATRSTA
jgi:hypothetical protein